MDNQQNDLITRVITIAKREDTSNEDGTGVRCSITDEGGDRYTVWKLKQDGTESAAWGQLKSYDLGERVGIRFAERQDVSKKTGKPVTYRTIRMFVEGQIAEPAPKLPSQTQSRYIPKGERSEPKPEQRPDWDAIAEGKVRHGFALEAYKMGKPLNGETKLEINRWVRFVMEGDFMAEGQGSGKGYVEPEDGREISVEEVPF